MRGLVPPRAWWGKLKQNEEGIVEEWHPLEDHCADVAACALELLELPLWNHRLAALGKLTILDTALKARLAAITGLHDLGKYSQGFQNKAFVRDEQRADRLVAGHVAEFFRLFADDQGELVLENALARALGLKQFEGWSPDGQQGFLEYLFAAAAHHGKPRNGTNGGLGNGWQPTAHHNPFQGVTALVTRIRGWLPEAFASGGGQLPLAPAFQHAFAGLVMLADWIASGFPYREPTDGERFPTARRHARRALAEMGLETDAARSELEGGPRPFLDVFRLPPAPDGTPATAHAAQRALFEAPLPSEASIEVLEAETGSGKTEAALYRFLQLFAAGAVDGLYFALPTRTAAIQLYERIGNALEAAFPENAPPLVLAVPGYLQVDGVTGQRLPDFKTLWPDHERFRYRGWAAENPKRFLVGSVVIGTIDQVLLSALSVSHSHLRATALLRHYLVVDEVHASDAYMTRILREVLRHHLTAGGQALLLSATLGGTARHGLLNPFDKGCVEPPSFESARNTPYPLVSRTVGEPRTEVNHDGRTKSVEIELCPIASDADRIAEAALDAAQRGARVAILRNTVGDAVRVQAALETRAREMGQEELLFAIGEVRTLHHSRFSKPDREALDAKVKERFGRGAKGAGHVVVATQTIQQSLDIDLDWLLTDLCPMDVLLQRIGRLHRHPERKRPEGFVGPRTAVLTPANRDLSTAIGGQPGGKKPHGLGTVYDDLRVIEATWAQLEARSVLKIPENNRELVECSTHPDALSRAVTGAISRIPSSEQSWRRHEAEMLGRDLAHKTTAGLNCMPWDRPFGDPAVVRTSDEKILTRLGEDDRLVEFSEPFPVGPFGNAVRRLTLSAYLAAEKAEFDGVWSNLPEGGFGFQLGKKRFQYDRWGVRVQNT